MIAPVVLIDGGEWYYKGCFIQKKMTTQYYHNIP